MSNHSVFSLRIGLVLAAVLLLGVPTLSGAATDSECSDAWDDSGADDSCSNEQIVAQGDDCWITALCQMASGGSRSDSITVSLASTDDINNCNGFLSTGSC